MGKRDYTIQNNVKKILKTIPHGVQVVAAAKTRTGWEIDEALDAGIDIIGHNYYQDLKATRHDVVTPAKWHFIGHLQRKKVKHVAPMCDMIETVDSLKLAQEIDKQCIKLEKVMPVLIEINIASEPQKTGVFPGDAPGLIRQISELGNIKVQGLMTMGLFSFDPEDNRQLFRNTKTLFDCIKSQNIPGVDMQYLSMGMSDSYLVAIEEGANLVRIGTKIFGPRA